MSKKIATEKNAREAVEPGKYTVGKSLYLYISSTGAKSWRWDYSFGGKRKTLVLGTWPEFGLRDVSEKQLIEVRRQLQEGIDPGEVRKQKARATVERGENTFESVAREWFAKQVAIWSPGHAKKQLANMENNLLPWLGGRPIAEISAPEVLKVLQRCESRGSLEMVNKAKSIAGRVFRYGIAHSKCASDCTPGLRDAFQKRKRKNFAALTDPVDVAALLRAIDGFHGSFAVQCALKLAPLVFTRIGELRQAEWSEFDLEAGMWTIQAYKMKNRHDHLVPLSWQAIAVLKDLHPLTGNRKYLFPGQRDPKNRCISDATLNAGLRSMGYDTQTQMTGHGFRATARTLIREKLKFDPDIVERQLSHVSNEELGEAYDRAKFMDDRIPMMQKWADYLYKLKVGATIVVLKATA